MQQVTLQEIKDTYLKDMQVMSYYTYYEYPNVCCLVDVLFHDTDVDYANNMDFYLHDGLLWETGNYSSNNLVPFLSSSQCYWRCKLPYTDFINKVQDVPLSKHNLVTEALGYSVTDINKLDTGSTWLESPVCTIKPTFGDYLLSLTAKRRYKVTKALQQSENYTFSVIYGSDLVLNPYILTNNVYFDFIEKALKEKWGEEYGFAKLNFLYAKVQRNTKYAVLQDNTGAILGIAYFVLRDSTHYFQGIVGSEHNIGAMLLSKYVEYLHTKPYEGNLILDPTCKTAPFKSSIDTYKRLITNEPNYVPLVSAFDENNPIFPKPYCYKNVWNLSDTVQLLD